MLNCVAVKKPQQIWNENVRCGSASKGVLSRSRHKPFVYISVLGTQNVVHKRLLYILSIKFTYKLCMNYWYTNTGLKEGN